MFIAFSKKNGVSWKETNIQQHLLVREGAVQVIFWCYPDFDDLKMVIEKMKEVEVDVDLDEVL